MQMETLVVGFVSGVVSGIMLLVGTWVFLLPKVPGLLRREALRDMSHYGRDVGKQGVGYLMKLLFHR